MLPITTNMADPHRSPLLGASAPNEAKGRMSPRVMKNFVRVVNGGRMSLIGPSQLSTIKAKVATNKMSRIVQLRYVRKI